MKDKKLIIVFQKSTKEYKKNQLLKLDEEKALEFINEGYAKLFLYPDKMLRRYKTN